MSDPTPSQIQDLMPSLPGTEFRALADALKGIVETSRWTMGPLGREWRITESRFLRLKACAALAEIIAKESECPAPEGEKRKE